MSAPRILLAVDLSYQSYRASAAHPMLTSRRVFTGGLYGFFTTVAKMIRETRATDIVFCKDVRPYERSRTYPEYKQLRTKNADDDLLERHKESMTLILDALHAARLPVWGKLGFEFDDLIGHVVVRYRHRFDTIYAGSNDSDLYQLFWCEHFKVYRQSIADVMDHKAFAKKYGGITSEQYILASALQGTHNDIAGIVGVGPVTALKAIKSPQLMREYQAKHGKLIQRNLGLIRLPHPLFPAEEKMPVCTDYRARELYRVLSMYEIDVTGAIEKSFKQVGER